MGQTNDNSFKVEYSEEPQHNKIGTTWLMKMVNDPNDQEKEVAVFVRTVYPCEYEAIADDLRSAGLNVKCDVPPILTGRVAIKNVKKLAELSCVVMIQGGHQLHTHD